VVYLVAGRSIDDGRSLMAAGGLFGTVAVTTVVWLAVHVALNSPIQPVPSPPPAARYTPSSLLHGLVSTKV
jgi:hypothetical protein